jgi:3'5'-cyclic nucleotide phosphodiesterase
MAIFLISISFYFIDTQSYGFQKFSQPLFFLIGGLGIVFTDPDVIQIFTKRQGESFCPSLTILILLTVVQMGCHQYSYVKTIALSLGALSMIINVSDCNKIERSIYLMIIEIIVCMKLKNKPQKVAPNIEKYESEEVAIDLDYVEIIETLQLTIDSLCNLDTSDNYLKHPIKSLKKIWASLKVNKNIYKARIENITKNMDEQDKLFIEQSCFLNVANMCNISENSKFIEKKNFSYGMSELIGILSLVGKDWNFNTFFLNDCSGGEPIQVLGSYSIHRYGLDEQFSIPENVIKNFLRKLESSYRKNPYHNSIHGGDVMCSFLFLINNSDISNHMSSIELLAGIIATLGHDAGHPGKTNRFLIMTRDDLATVYNDISVLEMMHTSIIFNMFKNADSNILANLATEKWVILRKYIIDMILSTDMSKHFDMMAQFGVKYHELDLINFESIETRSDLFKLMVKAADIGHAAKTVELHEKWCRLVVEEFYEQGDLEKSSGISVSMYCDRDTTDISKSQAGFIRNIVYPLFNTLNSILISEMIEVHCLKQLKSNELYWVMRRKTIRGQSLISRQQDYVNTLSTVNIKRKPIRNPSLPYQYPK